MKALAVITARGGSKRIPKKNIKEFCGKPILTYSVKAALESGIFDEVMVSTDDEEIARIGREAGAQVPFLRSAETSNDYATTADVLREVLAEYEKRGQSCDYICCIYPTAPFVTGEKLRRAYELIVKEQGTTVMPVVAYSFPPQRACVVEEGVLHSQYPEYFNCRSQDLQPIYHDVGQFYLLDVKEFLDSGKLIGRRTLPVIVDELEVQDIDNMTDWAIAEMKYRLMQETEGT